MDYDNDPYTPSIQETKLLKLLDSYKSQLDAALKRIAELEKERNEPPRGKR